MTTIFLALAIGQATTTPPVTVLNRTNQERNIAGLGQLKENSLLNKVAFDLAKDMATKRVLSHTDSRGRNLRTRVDESGYDWKSIGENIACGQESPTEVVKDWMESAHHKKNILNPSFRELGTSSYAGANGTIYWVQVFGS